MFYCELCRVERDWPVTIMKSAGRCEICDQQAVCNSRASSLLPLPKTPEKINYDRLNDFLSLFTKEERDSWKGDGNKAPDWVLSAMLWFMAQDPGHKELMRRLADS